MTDVPWPRPTTPVELDRLLREKLNLQLTHTPIMEGNTAPFAYLCHAFFEPPARAFRRGRAGPPRDCVVWANRGGGKTYLGAIATLLDMLFKPGISIRILGGSLEQSRRMHHYLAEFFAREDLARLVRGRTTRDRVHLTNGSTCEILAQSETSIRGTRVQKLRCDEVELFDPDLWEAAQLVTRSRTCDGVFVRGCIECFSTMHRPYGLMYRLVKQAAEGSRALFRWGVLDVLDRCTDEHVCRGPEEEACPLWDDCGGRAKARDASGSPSGHLLVSDAIDQKSRVDPMTWKSEMLCLRPSRTDTVLPEFDRAKHVISALPAGIEAGRQIAGMDFGYRSPTVVVWGTLTPDGVLTITDELVRTEMLLGEAIAKLTDLSRPVLEWIGVDPAGRGRQEQTGVSNIEVMRKAGLRVRWRTCGLAESLTLMRWRLAPGNARERPKLFIHERCTRLIESLECYHYPRDKPESLVPVKDGHDHAVDALRYLILNLDRPWAARQARYA
ncbi:MAG: hypothetical protein KF866_01305 [Phycisphaeraceae bacterium]|nr:hypothetical protein [Phycisphaeraceae bacterium]MCW5755022.1 hypothetical protein [Phycisphaeraceae bacterium]